MKYYFVSYAWGKTRSERIIDNTVISNIHPVAWLMDCVTKYQDENYVLIFWQEIAGEMFNLADKNI